ncbi:methionine ABC transporter ATP-binding protein [Actinopolymorpha alba]|uniref:methionine ABC transporter ATP-binding protein n=1 Tax=Actinopolymorpha alba TaxID=533267 RepID=UPI00035E4E44|nr:ATP-binding cassette domain-containing protein [Actinopolymorpha alba]
MIELDDIRKSYRRPDGDVVVLDGVDLFVDAGETFGIVADDPCTARALLRCVNLLVRPDEGTVWVAGDDLTAMGRQQLRRARHGIGMLVEQVDLFAQRTVARNVALPLEFAGVRQRDRDLRVDEMLDLVGLAEQAERYPAELSDEERCRVGIARAFVSRPRVLLSEESTATLEPAARRAMLSLVGELTARFDVTVVWVTQDYDLIKATCDGVALVEEGRVTDHGHLPDLLRQPGSKLVDRLVPMLPEAEPSSGRLLADLTVLGDVGPVLTETGRAFGVDISVVVASLETICGQPIGRLRVELTGPGEDCQRALLRFADLNLTPKVYI